MAQQQRIQRRLAAILAADVAGYSRLTGADEEGTLERLRALRHDVIDPALDEHHGRLVKTTGDGLLVEFASVVDAVRCAIAIQRGIAQRNTEVSPDRRILFRIGINLGDVVAEGDDLLGDGVNVAARLEGIAEPGGICLARAAYDQARGKIDLVARDLGEQRLKNIVEPVRVYSIGLGLSHADRHIGARNRMGRRLALASAIAVALAVLASGAWYWRNGMGLGPSASPMAVAPAAAVPRLSIVVLPFTNLSGDPAQQYLADVLTEELTTRLAQQHGTFVIATSTSFTYKGKPVDVKQVGKELGVRYVLEGSEQHSGDKVRVNAQLIDTETGAHLWADQFDAGRSDLLRVQDEIVTRIARELRFELVSVEASHESSTHLGNIDAEDLALRCEADVFKAGGEPAAWLAALSACKRSLEADDRALFAMVSVSIGYCTRVEIGQSTDRAGDLQKAADLVSRALALDPNYYYAHFAKAQVLMLQGRFEAAIGEGERSLAVNPSFINNYHVLAWSYNYLGQPDRALALADEAIRLSPRDRWLRLTYATKGWSYLMKEQYEQAIESLERAEGLSAPTEWMLAASYALAGRQADAEAAYQRSLTIPGAIPTTIAQLRAFEMSQAHNPAWIAYSERFCEGLRKAGMPEK